MDGWMVGRYWVGRWTAGGRTNDWISLVCCKSRRKKGMILAAGDSFKIRFVSFRLQDD